jgi:DNA polymerase-1
MDDQDVHATTAAKVYNIPLADVSREQRRFAKAVNFGLMYGMSAFGLADRSDMTLADAENFVKAYFEQFPKVRQYLDGSKRLAAEQGYLETLLKRKRYFPALQSTDTSAQADRDRRSAEREAVNFPIQGTAADILKLAMITLHRTLHERGLATPMILQVHDELVLEAPEAEIDEVSALVRDTMQNAFQLSVPLRVDVGVAQTWGEAK